MHPSIYDLLLRWSILLLTTALLVAGQFQQGQFPGGFGGAGANPMMGGGQGFYQQPPGQMGQMGYPNQMGGMGGMGGMGQGGMYGGAYSQSGMGQPNMYGQYGNRYGYYGSAATSTLSFTAFLTLLIASLFAAV